MALILNYTTKKGDVRQTSYHSVSFQRWIPNKKEIIITVHVYVNYSRRKVNRTLFDRFVISPIESDYDNFFVEPELRLRQKSLLINAYEFLKTIDPDDINSNYSDWEFDYKNDAKDSLTQDQVNLFRWSDQDVIFNETNNRDEQYVLAANSWIRVVG